MELSVIVPLFNEQDNIAPLHQAICQALDDHGLAFEIVLVDDGSSDATVERATALTVRDPRVRLVRLRRNYGQTPAMRAGMAVARGRILVTMDGDLQNDPQDIPALMATIDEGYDLVVGWRHRRQDKLLTRKVPSVIANWLIGRVTGVRIRDNGCSLKAYRATVIREVPLYSEMHRFIPAMASTVGCRVAEQRVRHHARRFGASKYGLSRVYKVLLDMLVVKTLITFSQRPLQWFAFMALFPAIGAVALVWLALSMPVTADAPFSLPFAATALALLALAVFLMAGGAVAELFAGIHGDRGRRRALVTGRMEESGRQHPSRLGATQGEKS